jgi:CRP-like cAMP-binding protein
MPVPSDEHLSRLRMVQLFESLSDEDLAELTKSGKFMEFPAGTEVTTEGRRGIGFHLILDGRAIVTSGEVEKATLGPGRYFGEMSLLDNEGRSATVTAATDLRTFTLASWDFMATLATDFNIARKILAGLSRRIRQLEGDAAP